MISPREQGPSLLERIDVALASRLVTAAGPDEPIAHAQQVFDRMLRPAQSDAAFFASLLRLRGLCVAESDAKAVLDGTPGLLSPIHQEFRMIRGLRDALDLMRQRVAQGTPPDGWFAVELWKRMTADLPRFRNNDLRRGPPWDAMLYVNYPSADQLPFLLDTFDAEHSYRDMPGIFAAHHPVRQGFRILWRFARIAPFADFNVVVGWMVMVTWWMTKGYPLIAPEPQDQALLAKLLSGPPPTRIVQFEKRLYDALADVPEAG